jgi:hypothetical protein
MKLLQLLEASLTETYYIDLIKKALPAAADQKQFIDHVYKTYGKKEWWSEWLGVSEKDILVNIKKVFKSL